MHFHQFTGIGLFCKGYTQDKGKGGKAGMFQEIPAGYFITGS
jgi:hypothetical protein